MADLTIGGLYSCPYALKLWSGFGAIISHVIGEMEANQPFVVLEVRDNLVKFTDVYQLKILTTDGIICAIDIRIDKPIKPFTSL